MRRMRRRRLEYIDLYCRKKRGKKNALTTTEIERLQYLEDKLEYETVLLYVRFPLLLCSGGALSVGDDTDDRGVMVGFVL